MEDDEEYSYKAYSARTQRAIGKEEEITYVGGDDEEYSYRSYAGAVGDEEEKPTAFGDFVVEEFSAEATMPKLQKITRLPASVVTYFFVIMYFAVGVICVALTHQVIGVLPYIVSGMMILIGVIRFILAVIRKEYKTLKTNKTATSLILTALGIMILIQHLESNGHDSAAITFISIIWGILGLFEGAHAFNHALKRISNGERCVYYLIKGIIEVAVAFYLLYDPGDAAAHEMHIVVFGAQLIFDAITMIPPVKSFLAMK